MNDKIIAVLQQMLIHNDLVNDVFRTGNEVYFRYKGHVFSIASLHSSGDPLVNFRFYAYPLWTDTLSKLADASEYHSDDLAYVLFPDSVFDTPTKRGLLKELYSVLQNISLGVEQVLDDILATA